MRCWIVPYDEWLKLPIVYDGILEKNSPYLTPGAGRSWDDELLIGVPDTLSEDGRNYAAWTEFEKAIHWGSIEDILRGEVRTAIECMSPDNWYDHLDQRCADLAGYWSYAVRTYSDVPLRHDAERTFMAMLELRHKAQNPVI